MTYEQTKALALNLQELTQQDLNFETMEKEEVEEILESMETMIDDWDYLVLTDEEADEKAGEYIQDSLRAFNAGFIIEHSKVLDNDEASDCILKAIQEQCENWNVAVLKLIDDLQEFIDDAIWSNGRWHFISMYDWNENEETIEGTTYFIYRMN